MAAPAPSVRLRVAAILSVAGGIVLVRHVKDETGYHLLPGGGVEAGETLQEALKREVLEETGLDVELQRLAFVNDSIAPDGSRHVVQLTFVARVIGGQITSTPVDERVQSVEVVDPDSLVTLDLRPPMAAEIREAIAHGAHAARYLGPLWSEPAIGANEAESP